jgi:hypothetical protein
LRSGTQRNTPIVESRAIVPRLASYSSQETPDEQHAEPAGYSGRRRVDCGGVTGFDAIGSGKEE